MGILETLQTEWPVIKGAPWSFAGSVLALTVALTTGAWNIIGWRKDATIDNKSAEIEALKRKVEELKVAAPTKADPLVISLANDAVAKNRDQWALYQFGVEVAHALDYRIDRSKGTIEFSRILGCQEFNLLNNIEFSQLLAADCRAESSSSKVEGGRIISQSFVNVVCRIAAG